VRKARELNPLPDGLNSHCPGITLEFDLPGRSVTVFKKPFYNQISTIVFSCFLLGCASSGDSYKSAGDPVQTRSNDCIFQSSIRDYQVLDDRNLIVSGGAKRKYHVELTRRAYGLRSNWSIGFYSPTGRICSGFSEVIVDDGFGRRESIKLQSVKELSPDEYEALLVRFGKKDPEEQEAPPAEQVEGAEVEELG
jgi:hypothetical protein